MRRRSATILDVANAAGVSTATVSRVLNGGQASQEARLAVEDAVSRLGYRRNDLARGLVTGRTGVIGVLIPDVSGPLYSQMASGIDDVLSPLDMHYMMVSDNRSLRQEAVALELLLGRQVDGLIIIGSQLETARLQSLLAKAPPAVLVQREWIGSDDDFSTVAIDNRMGVIQALDHLVARGHARIGHIAGVRRDGSERRHHFEDHLRELGLEPGPIVTSDSREEGGLEAGRKLLAQGSVDAVFCSNDRIALGLYRAARECGAAIPDDIAVVGFDDLPWTAYLDPPLTTIRQPAREMGRSAAEAVLEKLSGASAVERITLDTLLIERDSVSRNSGEGR